MQDQSRNCYHVAGLHLHSKPTLRSCIARTSCCVAAKSSSKSKFFLICSQVTFSADEQQIHRHSYFEAISASWMVRD